MTRAIRSLVAASLLACLLIGVPLLTWRAAGWPLPDEVPPWDHVTRRLRQGDIGASVTVRAIAVVVWITWAQLAWALIWELAVNIRSDVAGRPTRPAPLVFAPIGSGVARLVAVALAIGAIAHPMPTGSLAALAEPVTTGPAPPAASSAQYGSIDTSSPGKPAERSDVVAPVWIADRYDSLWNIAERALGDGGSVDEILELNPALTAAHTFRNGETVLLPTRASVPADRAVDHTAGPTAPPTDATYEVRTGDGMWDVAAVLLGDGARYPELIEMMVGQQVAPGVVFGGADHTLRPGWVFSLPASHPGTTVVVQPGDSLSSIAKAELGDPARWPELWEANRLRTMADGCVFDDPDLIHPGWTVDIPPATVEVGAVAATEPTDPAPNVETAAEAPSTPEPDVDAAGDPDRTVASHVDPEPDPREAPVEDRVNVWESDRSPVPLPADVTELGVAGSTVPDDSTATASQDRSDESVRLLTFDRAAMLSAGLLALLGVRRRDRLRRSAPRASLPGQAPRPVATERALRAVDTGERFARVDIAIRAAAMPMVDAGERVIAVAVATNGEVTIAASGPVELPLPWSGADATWTLPAITPLELLATDAQRSGAPCPTLVQLGTSDDERDVYVDLEAIEALEISGPLDESDAIVAAIASSLAASVMAEVTSLVTVGVPDEALLDHRHHLVARDVEEAFDLAADAVGSTRSHQRSTFELRARGTSGEAWEPAVVLVGSSASTVRPPPDRRALAIVSASPIDGLASRLTPVGTASSDAWELSPAGLRFTPIGLSAVDISALAELASVPEAVVADEPGEGGFEGGAPLIGTAHESPDRQWTLLVTMFGTVSVVDVDGQPAKFERSKTRELIAWLVTHRRRSTRSSARAALWEMDVRDATFANVVSEARRSMARLVEPPEGVEWIDRTLTDDLPLDERVWSDGDVIERALETAKLQPPAQAIATLRPAVDLINGMPFAGTSYLWPDAEGIASELVLLATAATAELAAHCLSVGDVSGVFAATARGLQVLPGHEELIGVRMRAHAKVGDRAGVRAEWESYERVLVGDPWSDGEPSPKLVDLRRSLLSG